MLRLVVAWAIHPNLIPMKISCIVPELMEPFMDGEPSLFLRASEIIHSKCDTLQF
jgi:hypothetical protein